MRKFENKYCRVENLNASLKGLNVNLLELKIEESKVSSSSCIKAFKVSIDGCSLKDVVKITSKDDRKADEKVFMAVNTCENLVGKVTFDARKDP